MESRDNVALAFRLDHALQLLERTPRTLRVLLHELPREWTNANEGPDTWSPFDVVGHLIHGEKTDWILRARIILERGEPHVFEPFNRFAQLEDSRGKTLTELLDQFSALRAQSLDQLNAWNLTEADLQRTGTHPEFGRVSLGELLATWVVHDLGHLAQIARAMAKRYDGQVGPWRKYLRILGD
jgi:hypothetical protein